MISVETVGKIRRRHLVKGESISKIARETGLSRNTVKRYRARLNVQLRT